MRLGLTFVIFLNGFLSACAQPSEEVAEAYLYRINAEGSTLTAIDDLLLSCQIEAAQTIPANNQTSSAPIWSSPTSCRPDFSGNVRCTGGQVSGGQISTYDANKDLRSKFLTKCIIKAGLKPAFVQECPKKLTGPEKYTFGLSPLDMLTIKYLNSRMSKTVSPPNEYTCIEPGDFSLTQNPRTNNLLLFHKSWSQMNSEKDLILKEHARDEYRTDPYVHAHFSANIVVMNDKIDFCTNVISQEDFIKRIRSVWNIHLGGDFSLEDVKKAIDIDNLKTDTCGLPQ